MRRELLGVGPVVSVLLAARMVTVVLAVVVGFFDDLAPSWNLITDAGATWRVLPVVVELPITIALLRCWQRRGTAWLGSWWFPVVESIVALLYFVGSPGAVTAWVYLALTLAVLSLGGGRRGAVVSVSAAGAVVAFVMTNSAGGWGSVADVVDSLATVLMLVMCSGVGLLLRRLLTEQTQLRERGHEADVLAASQAERLRIARDMHDTVTKTLAGDLLLVRSLQRRLHGENAALVDQVVEGLEMAASESRTLMRRLREMGSDDIGQACADVIERFRRAYPEIAVDHELESLRVEPFACGELAMALGEALENAGRHSKSPDVKVRLRVVDGCGELTVTDHGVGMPEQDLAELGARGHFGLAGMAERARALGGACEVESEPSRGTTVRLRFPLLKDETNQKEGEAA